MITEHRHIEDWGEQRPFVAFSRPGADVEYWSASPDMPSYEANFFATRFNQPFAQRLRIPLQQRLDQLPSISPSVCISQANTDRQQYLAALEALIERLAQRGHAKTVASIAKTYDWGENLPPDCLERLLSTADGSFNSCFYHPQSGYWAGSTPELLLKIDKSNGIFSTMALAGTVASDQAFTDKERREQQYVTDYIADCLKSFGANYETQATREASVGKIKHLRTDFAGQVDTTNIERLIDALNPTPALCGYPKDVALGDIAQVENHNRGYYGGLVGIETAETVEAYVNIRCAHFDSRHLCIYTGGGIVCESVAANEWIEALAKQAAVLDKLNFKI